MAYLTPVNSFSHAKQREKLLIVVDYYFTPTKKTPADTNGVVTQLNQLIPKLRDYAGVEVISLSNDVGHRSHPFYSNYFRLAKSPKTPLVKAFKDYQPTTVLVMTEGRMGRMATSMAKKLNLPVISFVTTKFDVSGSRLKPFSLLPKFFQKVIQSYLRRFHNAADATMVYSAGQINELQVKQGHKKDKPWGVVAGGIDTRLFSPMHRDTEKLLALMKESQPSGLFPRPWYVTLSRVEYSKNIDAFLRSQPNKPFVGTKIVIGDGPYLPELRKRYADDSSVVFLGNRSHDKELPWILASSDVFVFPSLYFDTFGAVQLEALASGLPVVTYNDIGPVEVNRFHGDTQPPLMFFQNDHKERLGKTMESAAEQLLNGGTEEFYRRRCAAYVREHYTQERFAKRFFDEIAKALTTVREQNCHSPKES